MEQLKTHPMEQPKEYSKEMPMESTWNPPKTLGNPPRTPRQMKKYAGKRLLELPGLYPAAKNFSLLAGPQRYLLYHQTVEWQLSF